MLIFSTLSMKSEDEININKYQLCKIPVEKVIKNKSNVKNIKDKLVKNQKKRNNYPRNVEDFDEKIKLIKELATKNNIPYKAIVWLWWRESNWGMTGGAKKDNIHFGVKCHGKKGVMYYDDCKGKCCFVSYRTFEDALKDLMDFFKRNKRYSDNGLFDAKTTEQAVIALKKAWYATDPNFLKNYYNEFEKLNIDEL